MMHYGPWIHHEMMLDNHHCYSPYIPIISSTPLYPHHHIQEQHHLIDEENEEAHDTTTSATSGERSSSADLFRLQFAAAQWSKLVSNAEGLFTKLMTSNILPHNEQDQIEQWLCMKQEYEECIANDDAASLHGLTENARRSLERIEEVTENDEKTDESANRTETKNNSNCSISSASDSSDGEEDDDEDDDEDQSDVSSENPDFLDRLDEYMKRFKVETDDMVDSKKDSFKGTGVEMIPSTRKPLHINNNNYVPAAKTVPVRNANSRRNSILPGSDMCNEVIAFNDSLKPSHEQRIQDESSEYSDRNIFDNRELATVVNDKLVLARNNNSPDMVMDTSKNIQVPEPIEELKTLALNKKAKRMQVRKIQSDLDGAQKHIEELQITINFKECFVLDMMKNSYAYANAKQRFQRKRNKLEEEYYNIRTQLAQAENASAYKDSVEKSAHKKEIESYKNKAIHYEKRLMDIEMIKQIPEDSARKVLEQESSLNTSKKEVEKLMKQAKKKEERKKQLEEELAEDQRKIRELEERYNLSVSKLREMDLTESEEEEKNGKATSMSTSKNGVEPEKKRNGELMDVTVRISHLDHVLKEKSMDLEKTADTDEKEALRHEIRNLRRIRDRLVDEKCNLGEKFQKLSTIEKRKLLECGEIIEAVDAMIEHKNEMICGRKNFEETQSQRLKGVRMGLMQRFAQLSYGEMVKLFYTYYRKVVDLKENLNSLEMQTAEQQAYIETLIDAIKQTKLEAERRIVLMQREYEEKLHLIFRHFAEETSSSEHERLDKDSELAKYKRENRVLRKRLADTEALLKGPPAPRAPSPIAKIPQQGFKQIAHKATLQPTTKVTRQGNKLIIQKTTDRPGRAK